VLEGFAEAANGRARSPCNKTDRGFNKESWAAGSFGLRRDDETQHF